MGCDAWGWAMHGLASEVELAAWQASTQPTIVRRFLSWAERADAGERAEAASALARAYLYSDISAALRREAAIGLTWLLDDPSALVRRALAEALAGAADAPHHIVLALACDQAEVSCPVLERSPVLTDAELVDCAAIGDVRAQIALARRPRLGRSVAAALAEIGAREAVVALAGNLEAELSASVLRRVFERFGEDAQAREALLTRPSLPASLRCDLVAAAAKALCQFVAARDWLDAGRAAQITREAAEQGAVAVANASGEGETRDLARHLRQSGALTIALLMRSLLSGDRGLFASALAELSGLAPARVAGFLREPMSAGFAALYRKTGLPAALLPAFRAALGAIGAFGAAPAEHISLPLTERVIGACESLDSPEIDRLLSLLRRFEAEAAREEVRVMTAHEPAALARLTILPREEAPCYAPMLIAAPALIEIGEDELGASDALAEAA